MALVLVPEPLTRAAFAPFGEVIETAGAEAIPINEGTTVRFNDLARIDLDGRRPLLSIFRGQPRPLPLAIRLMERHPLGTQAFVPLQRRDYLVVVAEGAGAPGPASLRAFRARGDQGVNYARNVWHHPLLVLEPDSDFLVIDRGGWDGNYEEHRLEADPEVLLEAVAARCAG
jgi:ureidoglycolate lyase